MMSGTQKNLNFHTDPTRPHTTKMLNMTVAVTTTSPKKNLKTVVRTWRWACVGSRDLPVFAPDTESNRKGSWKFSCQRMEWVCLESRRTIVVLDLWTKRAWPLGFTVYRLLPGSPGRRFQTPWVSEGLNSARVTHLFATSPSALPPKLLTS